jgi:hypothetical protein
MLPAWIQEVEQVVQQSFWGVGEAEARARISGKSSLNCILNCFRAKDYRSCVLVLVKSMMTAKEKWIKNIRDLYTTFPATKPST